MPKSRSRKKKTTPRTKRGAPRKARASRRRARPARAASRAPVTYASAGVDIDAGDALVDRIAPLARATRRPEVMAGVGGFSALCRIPAGYRDPVLVSSTDGVGTKLKLAFLMDRHDTIGIDLVGMVVNDLVTTGAEPLFLLDYFATGALSVPQAEAVVKGVAEGCRQAGCALVGGETAEMPGFYAKGEYDVAGFGVGVVERDKLLDGRAARAGDALVAVASSGLHSNGYSLVRRALLGTNEARAKKALKKWVPAFGAPLGDVLLTPTRIYAKFARAICGSLNVKGIAHITGGGIEGNLPRVFPDSLTARVDTSTWKIPPVFELVQIAGNVPRAEMFRTFNMGVGLVVIVEDDEADAVVRVAAEHGDRAWRVGHLVERKHGMKDCELA